MESKKNYEEQHNCKVVTQIEMAKRYYLAEEYHQKFLKKKRGDFRPSSSQNECVIF